MKNSHSAFGRFKSLIVRHKAWTAIIIIVVVGVAYGVSARIRAADVLPQYTLAMAHPGNITQTVTGSGQVSASNQTDILPQVSGTIRKIDVSVGQEVKAGQIVAEIDSSDASISLQNAQLSYDKLVQPAKQSDVTNSVNSLDMAYDNAYNAASNVYLDLPNIVAGLKGMFYDKGGFLTDVNITSLPSTIRTQRDHAGVELDAATAAYAKSLTEFSGTSRSSATSSIDVMLADTYNTLNLLSKAATDGQTTITYITSTQPDFDTKDAGTAASNINAWASQINSDLASIGNSQNSITSNRNSLSDLLAGADALDIQSARLNLQQAQKNYGNYFVRAPYDGTIGRIPVSVYGQAGGSTAIATIIGTQKIASISLNEVDAAKVRVGQPVDITFDAIDGLNATGTVSVVDLIGSVSQGVVSYGVKILINTQDPRIKPGMSVNTSIITAQESGVLTVPSSAVKTQGTRSYVLVLDGSAMMSRARAGGFGSTTRQFNGYPGTNGSGTPDMASSSNGFASSTRGGFAGRTGGTPFAGMTLTLSTSTVPRQVTVTTGLTDDTNTEITSGLTSGEFVVTKTVTGSATASTAAPSILTSFGGNRGGAAGAARPAGAAGGNATFRAGTTGR